MLENKIILRSVYKVTRCWMEPAKHPTTGRFPDVVRRVNNQGEQMLSPEDRASGKYFIGEDEVTEIYDGREFDLDDYVDAAWWEAIKYSRKIAQDRWEKDKDGNLIVDGNSKRYGNAEFYVERPGLESKQRNTRKRDIHEAKSYIYQDTEAGLQQKVRLLGNAMIGLPSSDVEDYLVGIAEKTPTVITELYTGTDTHLRLFFLDAVDARVIYNKDKLFYFGDNIPLGATDSAVINFFKNPDNKRIVDMIKRDVYPGYAAPETKTIDSLKAEDLSTKPKTTKR